MGSESSPCATSYRQALSVAAASLCIEGGYESAEELALETLSEMLQSYMCEIGASVRAYCEHGGRTVPTPRDVMCAFADVGFSNKHLPEYARRLNRLNPGQLTKTSPTLSPPVLQVGKRKNFPNYIPESYNYPNFPDPHAYIRTTTGQKPETDYVVLRERLSMQRRDVERALTRFVAKTGESHTLLPNDKNAFPLIAAEPTSRPYLAALLPSEHESLRLNADEAEGEQNKDSESQKSKKQKKSSEEQEATEVEQRTQSKNDSTANRLPPSSVNHNPYLRPVKKPKLKKKP